MTAVDARKQERIAALRRDAEAIAKLETQTAVIRLRRDKTAALLVTEDGCTWRETAACGWLREPVPSRDSAEGPGVTAVDAQALAETVRWALDYKPHWTGQGKAKVEALAALDGLVEALGQRDELLELCLDKLYGLLAGKPLGDVSRIAELTHSMRVAAPVPVRGDEPVDA